MDWNSVESSNWFMRINESLCLHAASPDKTSDYTTDGDKFTITDVGFTNSPQNMVHCNCNGINMNIVANSTEKLYIETLVEAIDNYIKRGGDIPL